MDVPLSRIEKSLSSSLKHKIRLAKCTKYKKKRIFRCRVADGPSSLPEVFLVKIARHTKREPYNPKLDGVGSPAWKLFNKWAALQFLGEIESTQGISPKFIAGDVVQGLIAFEYVSKARSFRDILRTANAHERKRALLAHAQAMGRMHGATYGRKNEWLRLRTSLGTFHQADANTFDGILRSFRRLATFVEQPVSTAVEAELSELKETLWDAKPFSALRHVDIAPQNYLLLNDGVKLVDFEYSDYGHFLLDAPLGPYSFPVRWECDEALAREIENVYRAELSSGFPGALDDAIYYKGVLTAWIYWLLRLGPIPNARGNTIKGSDALVHRCKAVARLSREIDYLIETLPRLDIKPGARILEFGCGTGPVACFLAELGYRVHGIDIIPDAIDKAKAIAAEQCLDIQYEVLDVCQFPQEGEPYHLIIDSYCSQSMVTDPDRDAMFSGIRSRLARNGYFLMSCCVFEPDREDAKTQIFDSTTGKVFTRFDQDALWDSNSETCYSPFQPDPFRTSVGPEGYEGTICVNDVWYIHKRCYRTPENLRLELERHGFTHEQNGEVTDNAICVHQGLVLRFFTTCINKH